MNKRRRSRLFLTVFLAAGVLGSATQGWAGILEDFGYKAPVLGPDAQKTEAELIDQTRYFEKKLWMSGAVLEQPELEKVLNGLLTAEELGIPPGVSMPRVRVLKDPQFNAMALPTGTIYLNTGLVALSRPDQLRFVIAHETMHILARDALFHLRDFQGKTAAIKLFDLAFLPAVTAINFYTNFEYSRLVGVYGEIAHTSAGVVYVAAVQGYGRAQETDADLFATLMTHAGGYDLSAVHDFFEAWKKRDERYGYRSETTFYSSHESNERRLKRIRRYEKDLGSQTKKRRGPDDAAAWRALQLPVIKLNAALDLKAGRFRHALDALEGLEREHPDAELYFLMGETYRLMALHRGILKRELEEGAWRKIEKGRPEAQADRWRELAEGYYRRVSQLPLWAADACRGLAQLYEESGREDEAAAEFRKYLDLRPAALDRRYVRAKLRRLTGERE